MSNLVYGYPGNSKNNRVKYIGETRVRFGARTHEHSFTDKQSSIYKHTRQSNMEVNQSDFCILETGFYKTVDRKIAEALYIKEYKPELNEQIKSHKLHLFN